MPALSRAVAATGPAIPPPMTSAVRTLDVAEDMGSLLVAVFVGCSAPRSRTGNPAILWLPPRGRVRLVRASVRGCWTGWLRAAAPGPGGGVGAPPRDHLALSSRLPPPSGRVRPAPGASRRCHGRPATSRD